MKTMFLALFLAGASSAYAGELKLSLHGTGLVGKTLYVVLHHSAEGFPMHPELGRKLVVVAQNTETELLIRDISAGQYALTVFADMNGNGKLDTNFIGIPAEPVGISRNAKGRFGPPKFADAVFSIGDGVIEMNIELN
jgi:uncharacterized protein (DUF2141 family)